MMQSHPLVLTHGGSDAGTSHHTHACMGGAHLAGRRLGVAPLECFLHLGHRCSHWSHAPIRYQIRARTQWRGRQRRRRYESVRVAVESFRDEWSTSIWVS